MAPLTLVMIVLSTGCLQSESPSARSNDRSTKHEIEAASETDGGATSTKTSTSTDSGGDENLGVEPDFSLTYFQDTKALFDTYCISCHGDSPASGASADFTLSLYDNVGGKLGTYSKRDRVAARVEAGSMPLGTTLPDDAKTKLLAWIAAGAPLGVDPTANNATAAFVNPVTAAEEPTNKVFTVRVAFTKVSDESYYDVYYTSTGATTGGTLIASDVPVDDLTTPWNTASVAVGGNYFLYLDLFDGEGTKLLTVASTGSVHVDNATGINNLPSVALVGAFNGSSVAEGVVDSSAAVSIAFTKADADGDPVTVSIEYSDDGGATFSNVVTAYAGASPYVWAAGANLEGVSYKIRLTANDGVDSKQSVSAAPFGITPTTYTFLGNLSTEVINTRCDGCHANKVSGFDSNNAGSVSTYKDTIYARVMNGQMPQDMAPGGLTDVLEKAKIQLWYWQGGN